VVGSQESRASHSSTEPTEASEDRLYINLNEKIEGIKAETIKDAFRISQMASQMWPWNEALKKDYLFYIEY